MRTGTAPLALALGFAPFAATAERVEGPAWDLLGSIGVEEIVTETSYEVRKLFPADVVDGIAQFDITGYVVPLYEEGGELTEFIIVSDMGFCPFCGSPEHGTSLLVNMAEPLTGFDYDERITLRGALEPVTDPETFQTTVLTGARVL